MASFNKGPIPSRDTTIGVSSKGNVQHNKTSEQVLFETLVSHMYGKDSYHEGGAAILSRFDTALADVLRRGQFQFVNNLVNFARNEMGMRSMPIYAGVKTAHLCRTLGLKNPLLKETVGSTISRADALTEVFALSVQTFGNKKAIPQAIKKALADSFEKFDEYQFAKYKSEGKAVWLRDVMRVVHPKPADEARAALYGRIKTNTMPNPETWEVLFTQNGQLPVTERKSDKDIWIGLLKSRKLGMLALLRNMRRMIASGMDNDFAKLIADTLTNQHAVRKSKVFPYQIYMSYKAMEMSRTSLQASHYNILMAALESALEMSVENVPDLGDNVWILLDTSGSMHGPMGGRQSFGHSGYVSQGPTIKMVEMAALFAAIVFKRSATFNYNVAMTRFDTDASMLNINPRDTVLTITRNIMATRQGGATYIWAALDLMPRLGFKPQTVILFSDMQVDSPSMGSKYGYDTGGRNTRTLNMFGQEAMKVAFNFAAGATTPASEVDGWIQLAGYSDKVFKFIEMSRPGYANTVVQNLMAATGSAVDEVTEEEEKDDE